MIKKIMELIEFILTLMALYFRRNSNERTALVNRQTTEKNTVVLERVELDTLRKVRGVRCAV